MSNPGLYKTTQTGTVTGGFSYPLSLLCHPIDSLQGFSVASTAPTEGQILSYSMEGWSGPLAWRPVTQPAPLIGYTTTAGVALGYNALYYQSVYLSGNWNTGVGYYAGYYHQGAGSYNAFFGAYSGAYATNPNRATYIGAYAGYRANGLENVAVGYQSMYAYSSTYTPQYTACLGAYSGYSLRTCSGNTLLGYYAGYSITSGSYNTIVGSYSAASAATGSFQVIIGDNLTGKGNNTTLIGSGYSTTNTWLRGNTLRVGNESAADMYFLFQRSTDNDTIHPGFWWDESASTLHWSHDGTTWNAFTTGGGGSTLTGYTETSGNFATALGFGTASAGSIVGAVCLGAYAGGLGASNASVHIGYYAGYRSVAPGGVFIGESAGRNLTVVGNVGNVCIGYQALQGTSGTSIACNQNTVVGYQAGSGASYNAAGNTLLGYQAGRVLSTGAGNTFIGQSVGGAATTAASTVLIGKSAGAAATGLSSSIAIGADACPTLQTGSSNLMLGYGTCDGMTSGSVNIAIGSSSGPTVNRSNTTSIGMYAGRAVGNFSVSIGERAAQNYGSGVDAISIGQNAANSSGTVTGANNISIGKESHSGIGTTSHNNIAVGFRARFNGSLGFYNIALGYQAGYNEAASGASGTVLLGYNAGYRNQGNYNIAIGYQSMAQYTTPALTGVDNVCIGRISGAVLSSGTHNVFLGMGAGHNSETCIESIAIGRASTPGVGNSNAIAIGKSVTLTAANCGQISPSAPSAAPPTGEFWFGDGSTQQYTARAQAFTAFSDINIKTNIEPLVLGLDFVNSLHPRLYDLKKPSSVSSARKHMGFIAQELKEDVTGKLDGSLVSDDVEGNWGVDYSQLVAPLVKAVQELSSQVADLKKELADLRAKEN